MKWRNEEGQRQDESQLYKFGDVRATKKFAWLPVDVGGDTVWLETYYDIQKWYSTWLPAGKSQVWDYEISKD